MSLNFFLNLQDYVKVHCYSKDVRNKMSRENWLFYLGNLLDWLNCFMFYSGDVLDLILFLSWKFAGLFDWSIGFILETCGIE